MPALSGGEIIYRVELEFEPAIAEQFPAWLDTHIREMLSLPGFLDARILDDVETFHGGPFRRTVDYRVRDREALDAYFRDHADRMREAGLARFGERFRATRRVLAPAAIVESEDDLPRCMNCRATLHGQYCRECGQRAGRRLIGIGELLRDFFGDLAHFDARIWRTLRPLLFRPGHLTSEYLSGRRVRFTPPLRLYLVISILFFVLLSSQGLTTVVQPGDDFEVAPGGNPDEICTPEDIQLGADWLDTPEMRRRLIHSCRRIVSDGGRSLARAMLGNSSTAMFLFLPLLALVMKFLYPLARRYYVEHLLFLVHNHAFFFLAMFFVVGFSRLAETWPVLSIPSTVFNIAVFFYVPVYFFIAMQKVYGQHPLLTTLKYLALGFTYIAAATFMVTLTLAYTALFL